LALNNSVPMVLFVVVVGVVVIALALPVLLMAAK
jgi:hypothetical protein